jgi:hypothetical protein
VLHEQRHAGTTDVDVQVDLAIAAGAMNTRRLEQALRNAGFVPDGRSVWRWTTTGPSLRTVIEFELLADLDTEPAEATTDFAECDALGAINLRGTGFASRDVEVRELRAPTAAGSARSQGSPDDPDRRELGVVKRQRGPGAAASR